MNITLIAIVDHHGEETTIPQCFWPDVTRRLRFARNIMGVDHAPIALAEGITLDLSRAEIDQLLAAIAA